MKIFQVITLAYLGGAQSVVINLIKEAVNEGHEVFVLSEQNGPMWDQIPDEVIKIRIKNLQRSINPLKDLSVMFSLYKAYKKHKPDVIHLHSSKIGLLGRLIFPSEKIIYTVHGFDSIRIAFKKFLPLERLLQSRTKHIVGVSNYDLEMMTKERISKNTSVIYNGLVDWANVEPSSTNKVLVQCIKKLCELKEDGFFIVLATARLSPQKRFETFRSVAKEFEMEKIKFVWVGNQYLPEDLPQNLICLGNVPNAYILLKYIDLFMLPSNYEGLPMSIIEALAYGRPVVASNVGGIGEILNASNGFAVSNNVADFVSRIEYYKNNVIEYAKASIAARKCYEDHFTIDKMYGKYLTLYNNIFYGN
jgi:glycosyltransferase involved in cell wall biosynthesis